MKIGIIGAGASGLLSAILLSQKGFSVDIFEQNSKIGKKLLASGNGRCNISNKNISENNYITQDKKFIQDIISKFGFTEFQKLSNELSLFLKIQEDGKIYPLSNEAKSVVSLFESLALKNGVSIFLDSFIKKVQKLENGKFEISVNLKKYEYDILVVATGSNSAPNLGGNLSGYEIAKSFGHHISPLYPSLAQLQIEKPKHSLIGVKIYSEIRTFVDNRLKNTIQGDILFTKYGVSGFGILDSSQIISKSLLEKKFIEIEIDFLPTLQIDELEKLIYSSNRLISLLPTKLINHILNELNMGVFNSKNIKKLAYKLKNYRLQISDTNGFKSSEISGGGVETKFIDSKTMESKLVKNLYFTGEILDVIGERGGYNLHFAWATAYLVYC